MTTGRPPTFFAWRSPAPLVLASGSATRRGLLEAAGVPVEVIAPDLDERALEAEARAAGATPVARARLLAREKALTVARRRPERLVLGADQTLDAAGHPGVKAADATQARRFLAILSGRRHTLHSAAALVHRGRVVFETVADADLAMRPLPPDFIAGYVDALGPDALSSVGGYQIEGVGAQLFERIEGDHATILGLPLFVLLGALRRIGALA